MVPRQCQDIPSNDLHRWVRGDNLGRPPSLPVSAAAKQTSGPISHGPIPFKAHPINLSRLHACFVFARSWPGASHMLQFSPVAAIPRLQKNHDAHMSQMHGYGIRAWKALTRMSMWRRSGREASIGAPLPSHADSTNCRIGAEPEPWPAL